MERRGEEETGAESAASGGEDGAAGVGKRRVRRRGQTESVESERCVDVDRRRLLCAQRDRSERVRRSACACEAQQNEAAAAAAKSELRAAHAHGNASGSSALHEWMMRAAAPLGRAHLSSRCVGVRCCSASALSAFARVRLSSAGSSAQSRGQEAQWREEGGEQQQGTAHTRRSTHAQAKGANSGTCGRDERARLQKSSEKNLAAARQRKLINCNPIYHFCC